MSALKALIKIALMSAFLFEEALIKESLMSAFVFEEALIKDSLMSALQALITSRISDPAPNFAEREHPIPEERAH